MEFKIVVNGPVYIEAIAHTEEERKEIVKGIKYTLKDLGARLQDQQQPAKETPEAHAEVAPKSPEVRLITARQQEYLDKLGVPWWPDMTYIEADAAIKQWKVEHGYNVNGR